MLLRANIRTPNQRVRLGLSFLFAGIVFGPVGRLVPGLSDSPLWTGLVQVLTVVLMAFGIYESASGAGALTKRK